MGITEDLADDLAKDTLAAAKKSDNDTIVDTVAEVLGATSTTAQEAYLTAVRVRRAVTRARAALQEFSDKADT